MGAPDIFLLAFPALLSIVNPLAGAFIFNEVTGHLTRAERKYLSGRVGLFSLLVMLFALWVGASVLNFFGISIAALRIAGGAVVALSAWHLLNAPEQQEARKSEQAGAEGPMAADMAFFPLTLPFTTGPGTISVAITLGAERPHGGAAMLQFFLGASAAAAAVAALVWVSYRFADTVSAWMGASARRTMSRLMAFLLLCVGVQILLNGVLEAAQAIQHAAPRAASGAGWTERAASGAG